VASATAWLADGLAQDAASERRLTAAAPGSTEPGTPLAAPPAGVLDSH
jgi:hypothetical protein